MFNEGQFENSEISVHTKTEAEACINYYSYMRVWMRTRSALHVMIAPKAVSCAILR